MFAHQILLQSSPCFSTHFPISLPKTNQVRLIAKFFYGGGGGDFNVTLDPALDCFGGNPALKESVKFLEDIMTENDLVQWHLENPEPRQ